MVRPLFPAFSRIAFIPANALGVQAFFVDMCELQLKETDRDASGSSGYPAAQSPHAGSWCTGGAVHPTGDVNG